MKVTFPVWKSYEYVEVFQITEMRNGRVYKTRSVGYAHRDRPKGEMEIYASLPLCLLRNKQTVELELI